MGRSKINDTFQILIILISQLRFGPNFESEDHKAVPKFASKTFSDRQTVLNSKKRDLKLT